MNRINPSSKEGVKLITDTETVTKYGKFFNSLQQSDKMFQTGLSLILKEILWFQIGHNLQAIMIEQCKFVKYFAKL